MADIVKPVDPSLHFTRHLAVWASALIFAALAPTIVRVLAAYLERRSRARADDVVRRLIERQQALLK